MCQAISEMLVDSKLEGKLEGKLADMKSAMQYFHINMEQAMEALQFTEAERNYCLRAATQQEKTVSMP